MAVPHIVRKSLKRVGLLKTAQSLKHAVAGKPQWYDFKPADPRSQVSTLICFEWLRSRSLLAGTDYLEFGIFRGFNLWFAQAMARVHDVPDMRFFGFDSFFGLPAGEGTFQEGEFSAYREEVEYYLTRYGANWAQTKLVEGFFDKTLVPGAADTLGIRTCAFCVVDCDLYLSTVPVLQFVAPLLAPTAIVYFDDWDDFQGGSEEGEARAFAEFMAAHGDAFTADPLPDLRGRGGKGKAFVLMRR